MERIFRRKLYERLLEWKRVSNGKTAIMVEGARRVGKSTLVELFAKNEYESYIIVDFNEASDDVRALFDNLINKDYIFLQLQSIYNVILKERKSVIVFDEVQSCPKARQAIKYLVKDGRYDYIETGSLISIKKNTKDITLPSEEERVTLYPMDYEEFRWAMGDETTVPILRTFFDKKPQMLAAAGNKLFYYTWAKDATHNYEIDFLLSRGAKLQPIEVKSSGYKSHTSLDAFCDKYSHIIERRYLIYTKDLKKDGQTVLLPVYMTPFL